MFIWNTCFCHISPKYCFVALKQFVFGKLIIVNCLYVEQQLRYVFRSVIETYIKNKDVHLAEY
jgi:hypothetical protein